MTPGIPPFIRPRDENTAKTMTPEKTEVLLVDSGEVLQLNALQNPPSRLRYAERDGRGPIAN